MYSIYLYFNNKMYEETIKPKAITPFDKEMVEKFDKVRFEVKSDREIDFMKNNKVKVDGFLK